MICVERYCELGKQYNSTVTQSRNTMHWRPPIQKKKKERRNGVCWKSVKILHTDCSEMPVFGPYTWYFCGPWTAVTKWSRVCDKRLARLISYIHHTCEFKQCCHVGSAASQCRLGLFQDCDFAGDLEDSKSTSGGVLCIFGSHTYRGKVKADDDELGHLCISTSSSTVKSPIATKSGETHSTLSSRVLKDGTKMHFWTYVQGNLSSQDIQTIQKTQETREPKAIGQTISKGLLNRETTIWSQSDGSNERPRCEHNDVGYIHVCDFSSCNLGKDYTENLRSTKNQPLKSLRQIFQVTENLITDQTEITGVTTC